RALGFRRRRLSRRRERARPGDDPRSRCGDTELEDASTACSHLAATPPRCRCARWRRTWHRSNRPARHPTERRLPRPRAHGPSENAGNRRLRRDTGSASDGGMTARRPAEGILLALVAAALWGFTPIGSKIALAGYSPEMLSIVRLGLSTWLLRLLG